MLSFAQQRLWFLDRLRPGRPDHNVPTAIRLRGRLDQGALVLALTEVVRRHEVLRGRIVVVDDSPYQATAPVESFTPTVTDLTDLSAAHAHEQVRELVARDAQAPFDLGSAPMLRARLIRVADEDHVLSLVIHHIAVDGWSLSVLWREFSTVYRAAVSGREADLAELSLQYRDFARWQRSTHTGSAPQGQLEQWRRQFAGRIPSAFPTDRPRPALWSGRGDQVDIDVPGELSDRIRALGQAHDVTPFITLLAAFQVLLAHHSGVPDVPVGTPISGRTRIEVEPLVGFFVNTLVLRADLCGDPGFGEVLDRARRCAADAYAHQDVPFERLVEEVGPERDLGRHPLFTVMFQLDEAPALPSGLPGLTVSAHPVPHNGVKFDVEVSLTDHGDHFSGVLRYATDLFDHHTMERIAREYRSLLDRLVSDPERPISAWGPRLGPEVGEVVPPARPDTVPTATALPATAPCRRDGSPTETELLVLDVWAGVLGVTPDSVHADFFAWGGHSLLVSKVMSRLSRALGLELPLALLFHHPTVTELAHAIEAELTRDLVSTGSGPQLSPAGEGLRR
ncbi:condensation domain-containing protein [Streptomyces sp. NPDC047315]|uniref:condensation domain-containing protein n=1 Tax=Streptomyces sp. NPDC047315 TaxID=3155142 RepID=UPI0033F8610E